MRDLILSALLQEARGKYDMAKANLEIYLSNPAGIGEHSEVVEEARMLIDRCVEAKDRVEFIMGLQSTS